MCNFYLNKTSLFYLNSIFALFLQYPVRVTVHDKGDEPTIIDRSLHLEKSTKADSNIHLENELVDPNLVQIRASSNDLNERIAAFIERKRQQVNVVNIQEFCFYRLVFIAI